MKTNRLVIKQLDKQIKKWNSVKKFFQPKHGWIHTLRKALGMTAVQLAKRLHVSRSRIIKIESDECKQALTMKTLNSVAHALNCDFVYAFIPKKPLTQLLEEQAQMIANEQINRINHTMLLENQSLSQAQNKQQIAEIKNKLLSQSFKSLWNIV
jgi:predicted DNA-binding mobile mystery protein A